MSTDTIRGLVCGDSRLDLDFDSEISQYNKLQIRINSLNSEFRSNTDELYAKKKQLNVSKILEADNFVLDHKLRTQTSVYGFALGLIIPAAIAVYKFSTGETPNFSNLQNVLAYFYDVGNPNLNGGVAILSAVGLFFGGFYSILRHDTKKQFKKLAGCKLTKETASIVETKADYIRKLIVK